MIGIRTFALSRVHRALIRIYGTARARFEWRRGRARSVQPGITIVTVNWNTLPFLRVLIDTVVARSPEGTKIIVVDNASDDGSQQYLSSRPEVESIPLRVNIGHGKALDIGVARVLTEYVVVLDVDAFPIRDGWLSESLSMLDAGSVLSGAYFHRSYIHPCFLVFRRDSVLMNDLSFAPIGRFPSQSQARYGLFLDVGEAVSQAVTVKHGADALHRVPFTEVLGPGMGSTVFGDVVYHNFHTTHGEFSDVALQRFGVAVERFGASGWDNTPTGISAVETSVADAPDQPAN